MCDVHVLQGTVEAGNERPVNITWTPPAGHEVGTPHTAHTSLNLTNNSQ